jgi:7-cyano-7-deazaguanine synthase
VVVEAVAEALVLLSGGVDSAVCLFSAVKSFGADEVTALTFDWGQLSFARELKAARDLAAAAGIAPPLLVRIKFPYVGPLTDEKVEVPLDRTVEEIESEVAAAPAWFPGRNLVLLAYAFGLAYTRGATAIYFGAGASDAAGFPDCRPDFVAAVESAGNLAMDERKIEVVTPLIHLRKAEIVTMGEELGIPWDLTFSCYTPIDGEPCGRCDSCTLRRQAFTEAGITQSQ